MLFRRLKMDDGKSAIQIVGHGSGGRSGATHGVMAGVVVRGEAGSGKSGGKSDQGSGNNSFHNSLQKKVGFARRLGRAAGLAQLGSWMNCRLD